MSRVRLRGSMRSGGKTCTGAGALFTCKSFCKLNKRTNMIADNQSQSVSKDWILRTGTDNKSSHDKSTNVKNVFLAKIFFSSVVLEPAR